MEQTTLNIEVKKTNKKEATQESPSLSYAQRKIIELEKETDALYQKLECMKSSYVN